MKTVKEYFASWNYDVRKHPHTGEIIYSATPKNTIDPVGKRLTAGSQDTLRWLLAMNYKEEIKNANIHLPQP